MADTSIEWADKTWNPLLGCERVSAGCDGCYAITTATIRAGNPHPKVAAAFAGLTERRDGRLDWTGRINLLPDRLTQPLRWKKPARIFVNSQSDLFHKDVPAEYIARVLAVIAATPQHTYQLLTKRHARMRSLLTDECRCGAGHAPGVHLRSAIDWAATPHSPTYVPGIEPGLYHRMQWPLPNLHVGVSVEDQKTADMRIPALLDTPAAVRWLSMEPLLGPVNLYRWIQRDDPDGECVTCGNEEWTGQDGHPKVHYCADGVCTVPGGSDCPMAGEETGEWCEGPVKPYSRPDWVVVGGESGPGSRPMHPDWARSLRDQCTTAGVPFFFKQWGEYRPGGDPARPCSWIAADGTSQPGMAGTSHTTAMVRVGKKAAGRQLDGRTWDEFPAERAAVAS